MASVKSMPSFFKQSNSFFAFLHQAFCSLEMILDEYQVVSYSSETALEMGKAIPPNMDVVEDADHLKIEFEMPGMGENDITVTIDSDGVLTVHGEKDISRLDVDKHYLAREINYGIYERSLALPPSVDLAKINLSFKKGMLWVWIPRLP